ncbi:MAG: AmmeMemoRadiSam system protein B [Planctomycetota bacterium]
MPHAVHPSPLAGTWYPDDPQALRDMLDAGLARAPALGLGSLRALVLPHAGYSYSADVALAGLAQVRSADYKRIVIIGPAHRVPLPGMVSAPSWDALATPLGEVPVDTGCIATLQRHPAISTVTQAHASEHSVQIQVPLIQHCCGAVPLVPLVVGELDLATTRSVARAIVDCIDADTLVVASTDFTHYGRNFGFVPFTDDIPANLERLDMEVFARLQARDLPGWRERISQTGATICGRNSVGLLLAMLEADDDDPAIELIAYTTSGVQTGDFSHCVSYLSAGVTGAWAE